MRLSARARSGGALGVGLLVILCALVLRAPRPIEGEAVGRVALLKVDGVDIPFSLAMDPDGVHAWVLGASGSNIALVSVGTRPAAAGSGALSHITERLLPLTPGAGDYYSALAVSDEFVVAGWGEELAWLDKPTGSLRVLKLRRPQRMIEPDLIPVDNLQPNQSTICGIRDVKVVGKTAWVARMFANSVLAVDLSSGATREVALPAPFGSPEEIAVDGSRFWLTSGRSRVDSSSGLVPKDAGPVVSHDKVAILSPDTEDDVQVFSKPVGHVIPRPYNTVLIATVGGIDRVNVSGAIETGLEGSTRLVAVSLGPRSRVLATAAGGVVTVTPDGVTWYDGSGKASRFDQFSKAWVRPSLPALATATTGPEVELSPDVRAPSEGADGAVWMAVPNYGALGVALP